MRLLDTNDQQLNSRRAMGEITVTHFRNLLVAQPRGWTSLDPSHFLTIVTPRMNAWLLREPTIDEVKGIVFKMKRNISSCPNGIPIEFYQKH